MFKDIKRLLSAFDRGELTERDLSYYLLDWNEWY